MARSTRYFAVLKVLMCVWPSAKAFLLLMTIKPLLIRIMMNSFLAYTWFPKSVSSVWGNLKRI